MIKSRAILVTGCAGFIGSNFAKKAKELLPDIELVGIDDFSTGRKSAVPGAMTFYEGSILDEKLLESVFSKHRPEYVFHFAALPRVFYSIEYPVETTEANVTGTIALLNAAKNHGVKRLIYSSSSSVYGGADKMPTIESENFPDPKSPYAAQKYSGEVFCKVYSNLFELDTVCLRYFTVFGPGQFGDSPYSTVIAAWLESLYYPDKKEGFIEGDGTQTRDFCYIDNVVMANLLAMKSEKPLSGDVFNVAHGQQTSLNEVRSRIEEYTSKKLNLEQRPNRPGDVKHTFADISKVRNILGYNPTSNFEEGLRLTIDWFESRKSEVE